jgi:hypothetical protein
MERKSGILSSMSFRRDPSGNHFPSIRWICRLANAPYRNMDCPPELEWPDEK